MAEDRMAVLETVRKAISDGDVDFLREGVRVLAEADLQPLGGFLHGQDRAWFVHRVSLGTGPSSWCSIVLLRLIASQWHRASSCDDGRDQCQENTPR